MRTDKSLIYIKIKSVQSSLVEQALCLLVTLMFTCFSSVETASSVHWCREYSSSMHAARKSSSKYRSSSDSLDLPLSTYIKDMTDIAIPHSVIEIHSLDLK